MKSIDEMRLLPQGKLIVQETGEVITYSQFFKAFMYDDEDYIYLRTYYDDENDTKEYREAFKKKNGRNPDRKKGESFNPLRTKFNKKCRLKDFDDFFFKEISYINTQGYGAWFVVNGGGQSGAECKSKTLPRAQFMEWDDFTFQQMEDKLEKLPIKPSLVIVTKKSFHVYWFIDNANWELWREIQERLIAEYRTDERIKDASRVLRVPGTYHNKDKNNRVPCFVKKWNPELRYEQKQFLDILPEVKKNRIASAINLKSLHESDVKDSEKWMEAFLNNHSIPYEKQDDVDDDNISVLYKLVDESTIPWIDEYTTPWSSGETSVIIRNDGSYGIIGFHHHDEIYTWSDFRKHHDKNYATKYEQKISIPFILSIKGKIIKDLRNYVIALHHHPSIQGKIRFDDFTKRIMIYGSVPWDGGQKNNIRPWTDNDTFQTLRILCEYDLSATKTLEQAINIVAHENRINPLTDFLDSLEYKGDGYIRRLLPEYMGCEDSEYTYQAMRLLMVAMVRRAFSPGCKYDYVVTFVGAQGSYKSSFWRTLVREDDWFTDDVDSFSDRKKLGELIQGKWLAELPEMSAMRKSEIESIKACITSTCDSYREAYGHFRSDYKRVTVFVGTTNEKVFLKDSTGNRRFLVVPVDNRKATKDLFFSPSRDTDFNGAWAEAVHIVKETEKQGEFVNLTLPPEVMAEATSRQEQANAYEEWEGLIFVWLNKNIKQGFIETCALDVWCNCLNKDKGTYSPKEAYRINPILDKAEGWEKVSKVRIKRTAEGGKVVYFDFEGRGYKYSGTSS